MGDNDNMYKWRCFFLIGFFCLFGKGIVFADSLSKLIQLAHKNNSGLLASHKWVESENELVFSEGTMEYPMVGVAGLDSNRDGQHASITQNFKFPFKYYLQAKSQSSRVRNFNSRLQMERFEVRSQIVSLYFSIYSAQKIIQLTEANMQAVKEFARVAEKKYSAGKSPQSDSMKAHFELTQLELDLLRLVQEEEALQENLKSVINEPLLKRIELANRAIVPPEFHANKITNMQKDLVLSLQNQSPILIAEKYALKEAEYRSVLAKWEFAPDFQIQFQQSISGNSDLKAYSLGLTIPLWFWKGSAEVSAAAAKRIAQEFMLYDKTQKLTAKVRDLIGKVQTEAKALAIYETSLIPQAQGAYKSARAAYQASQTSFLDLLDSERSLYRVQIGFFQTLKIYVGHLSELEAKLGLSVSNLEMDSEE